MDVLYILGEGYSECDHLEMKCSLRSIEKYGKNVGKVYVVGYCPNWLSDEVVKIPFIQPYPNNRCDTLDGMIRKHINLLSSLLYAVDNSDIGSEFLVSSDDHILLKTVDFDDFPYYCKLIEYYKDELPKSFINVYTDFLMNCREELEKQDLSVYYLTLHKNMHMSRKVIDECREYFDKVVNKKLPCEPFTYLLNYQYTKYHNFEKTDVKDYKIRNKIEFYEQVVNGEYNMSMSTYDFNKESNLYELLNELFPSKCKYEL